MLPVGNMILKQPSLILAPHITPFFFTLDEVKIYDMVPVKVVNGKNMKCLSCIGTFAFSRTLTKVNALLSMSFSVALLSWKGHWVRRSVVDIMFSIFMGVFLLFIGKYVLKWVEQHSLNKFGENQECINHSKKVCLDCIQKYGIYYERYKYFEACEEHDLKKPYEYQYQTKNCAKCKDIKFRFVVLFYIMI
jgi:hypothetical protein